MVRVIAVDGAILQRELKICELCIAKKPNQTI